MPIQILTPDVVGQIAAGEVLERPANLLKELIENSLDAGADRLEIEFGPGGRDVVIQDNGIGMGAEDMALALTRFATSKIHSTQDIYKLNTFGFRGEALASIAAVSQLSLTSRPPQSDVGRRIAAEFGRAGELSEIAAPSGTEIRVRELFANVPARLSFMKSDASESGQIKATLKAMALSHEHVAFRVRHKGALLFHWPASADLASRAAAVLECGPLYRGEATVDGVTAEVLVGSPHETARLNRNLWFFVQGRWVQDRALGAAVMEGYRNLLMHGEYPTAVVRVTCAPEEVDVNVHPTKAQVRFREPSRAFRAVCRAVREVLERAPWLGDTRVEPLNQSAASGHVASMVSLREPAFEPQTARFDSEELSRVQYATKNFSLAEFKSAVASLKEPAANYVGVETSAFRWSDLQVIGQLNLTYIVSQNAVAMYLVDQHAAHERVVFERLMRDFLTRQIEVQSLLMPLVFDFSEEDVEALHKHRGEIARLGLHVEQIGPSSLAVTAIPALLAESAIHLGLQKLGAELNQHGGSLALEKIVGDIFASMACHSVIRAGQSQSAVQMQSLLAQMDEFPLSSFCPHGRPVSIRRPFRDLEREFGRLV